MRPIWRANITNKTSKKLVSLRAITDDIFKFTTNFTETLEAGEAWVNKIPGVKAWQLALNRDIVLDYVDKGVAIVELAKNLVSQWIRLWLLETI